MSAREFLASVSIILATMALIAVVELIQPLFTRPATCRGRSTANLGLMVLTLALNWALTSAAAIIALVMPLQGPGLMTRLGMPVAAQVVASVAVLDFFFGYLAHRAMHMSPLLWRIHRVHHSDPFVDATTTYRTHPLEVVWRFLFLVVPIWTLGVPAEAVVMYRLLSALNGILEHANIRLWQPLDSALSLIWVTPNMHKVHHSRVCVETDSNYGNLLAVGDRLLWTFVPTSRAFSVAYGLDDADPLRATSLARLLVMPFESASATGAPDGAAGDLSMSRTGIQAPTR